MIDTRHVWTKEQTATIETADGPTIIRYYLPSTQEEVDQFIDIFGWEDYTRESSPISGARLSAINEAIAAIEAVANIDFQRVNTSQLQNIEFVFLQSQFNESWTSSLSTRIAQSYTQQGQTLGLEATLLSLSEYNDSSDHNSSGLFRALHEIGHAIGLKHPRNSAIYPFPRDDIQLHNLWENTIMGYRGFVDNRYSPPSQPQIFDILALQEIYGANPNGTNADDTVYDSASFTQNYTIYDTGGIDTIDFSNEETDYSEDWSLPKGRYLKAWVEVDLLPGASSNQYFFISEKFAIAFDTIIENVIGTQYSDTIRGNDADNVLEGGAGGDTLDGRGGSDTASYINSPTGVLIDLNRQQQDFRDLGYGTDHGSGDRLINIENVIGSRHDDILVGNHDNNRLEGRGGDDILTGGPGKDIFVLEFGEGKGHTTITDWQRGVDRLFLKVDDELEDVAAAFENGLLSASRPDAHTFEIYLNSAPTEDYLTVQFFDTIAGYSSFRDALGGAEYIETAIDYAQFDFA